MHQLASEYELQDGIPTQVVDASSYEAAAYFADVAAQVLGCVDDTSHAHTSARIVILPPPPANDE